MKNKLIAFTLTVLYALTSFGQNLHNKYQPEKEVGFIQYEERTNNYGAIEFWVTNGIAATVGNDKVISIPSSHNGKTVRGIKYNATFSGLDDSSIYGKYFTFYGTDLEVLRHDKTVDEKQVFDYYEHPAWNFNYVKLSMPNVREIPNWCFFNINETGSADAIIGDSTTDTYNNIDLPNVERIGTCAFANAIGDDTRIYLPALKYIGSDAFANCTLISVEVPELLEMNASSFGAWLDFLYAPKVQRVHGISTSTSTNNTQEIPYPGQKNSCFKSLETVYLPNCEEIGNNVFYYENTNYMAAKKIYLPKCKRVGDNNWFFNVEELYLPQCEDWNGRLTIGVDSVHVVTNGTTDVGHRKSPTEFPPNTTLKRACIGTKSLNDHAFRGCTALEYVELPNLEIGAKWAFANCTNLAYVEAPKMIHGGDNMFLNCSRLNYAYFPELKEVSENMFKGCSKIKKLVGFSPLRGHRGAWSGSEPYSEYGELSMTSINGTKSHNGSINTPSNIDTNLIPFQPFNIEYDNTGTNVIKISWGKNQKLNANYGYGIIIPKVEYIGQDAFRAYSPDDYTPSETEGEDGEWTRTAGNIRSIDLPNVKEIAGNAFKGQRNLHKLHIPKCEIIGDGAFAWCGSFIEDSEEFEKEHILETHRLFKLDNVRKIGSKAFAHARFGYLMNNADDKAWWHGIRMEFPLVTYIAPDAFEDTWKILEIYAPCWPHDYSLFEYKNQFDWGHRKQDGDHSLTNIVWLERDYITDLYGEKVNLYQKIHSTFTRKLESTDEDDSYIYRTTLPKSYGYVYEADDWGTSNYKLGPFSINEDDILTITFKAAPIGNIEANHTNLWTENDCYDNGGGIYFSAWDENDEEWYYDEVTICDLDSLNQRPWIAYQRHDHGDSSIKPSWYQMDIINETEQLTITLSNIESDDLYVRIYSDFSYLCLADIEVRINGKLTKLVDLPDWVNNQITQLNNQLDNRISTNVYAIISNLVINGGVFIDNVPYKLVVEDASAFFTKLQFSNGDTIWANYSAIPDNKYIGSSLTNIVIGNNVTNIGNTAFKNCLGLKNVTIYGNIKNDWSMNNRPFNGCTNINTIILEDKFTKIGNYMFLNCSGLTSVTISDGVTSIGKYAFYGCDGLTSVTIPDSVTSIEYQVFSGCSGLTEVTFEGKTKAQVQAMNNYNNWFNNVPSGLILHCTGEPGDDKDIHYN